MGRSLWTRRRWGEFADPILGRFLQTDPIGYEDDLNLYLYARGDPLIEIDAAGLCTGSLIEQDDGTCASGDFTVGSGGIENQSSSHHPASNENATAVFIEIHRGGRAGRGARSYSPADRLQIDLFNRAVAEIRRFDPGYAVASAPGSVPTREAIARVSRLAGVYNYFHARGISIHPHAAEAIAARGSRGVTPEASLRAYQSGRIFHDPANNTFIRRDAQTGVYVVMTQPTGGQIISAMQGSIRPRWNPVQFRDE